MRTITARYKQECISIGDGLFLHVWWRWTGGTWCARIGRPVGGRQVAHVMVSREAERPEKPGDAKPCRGRMIEVPAFRNTFRIAMRCKELGIEPLQIIWGKGPDKENGESARDSE